MLCNSVNAYLDIKTWRLLVEEIRLPLNLITSSGWMWTCEISENYIVASSCDVCREYLKQS